MRDERFEPARAARSRARVRAPGRQVDLAPRRAARARWASGRSGSTATCARPTRWRRSTPSRALGASVDATTATRSPSPGSGCAARASRRAPIDVRNSGTLLRLLPGWLRGQPRRTFRSTATSRSAARPVDRIAAPLALMGARARGARRAAAAAARARRRGCTGSSTSCRSRARRSCRRSCSPALLADGPTTVVEPQPSRDHTERMLLVDGRGGAARDGARITVEPARRRRVAATSRSPGDPSSAAFLIAAALLVAGSRLRIDNVAANWTRTGFVAIARRMGAASRAGSSRPGSPLSAGEPAATLDGRARPARRDDVAEDEVALAIDELPLVALLGCFAEGDTVVARRGRAARQGDRPDRDRRRGARRARRRRSRRRDDGFVVRGGGGLRGGALRAHGDHRLAMLGAIAGLASREGVEVDGIDAAARVLPRLLRRPRAAAADDRRDRRPRRRRQVDGRRAASRARSASATSTAARCTAASRSRASRTRRARRPSTPPRSTSRSASACCSAAAT